jgi:hypothetical protein
MQAPWVIALQKRKVIEVQENKSPPPDPPP